VGGFILVHGRSLTDILREYVRYGIEDKMIREAGSGSGSASK
jgi:hypothetical protein